MLPRAPIGCQQTGHTFHRGISILDRVESRKGLHVDTRQQYYWQLILGLPLARPGSLSGWAAFLIVFGSSSQRLRPAGEDTIAELERDRAVGDQIPKRAAVPA